jgi:hypothetical protein
VNLRTHRLFYFSLALVTGTALGFEILLMRYFTLSYGHHFASSIISMALLGIGLAGTVLQLNRERLLPRVRQLFPASAALFGVSMTGTILLVRLLPFNPGELTWSGEQWVFLALDYLLLALPFVFSGFCTALAMASGLFPPERLYRADLLGAGAGGLGVLSALFLMTPQGLLKLLTFLGLSAAGLSFHALQDGKNGKTLPLPVSGALLLLVSLSVMIPSSTLAPLLSDYKDLARLQLLPETRILGSAASPLGRIDIAESATAPLRSAPGLSPICPHPVPIRPGIYVDGELYGPLPGQTKDRTYLDCLTSKLAFRYLIKPRVFIKNIFASPELLDLARQAEAASVTGSYEHFMLPELIRNTDPGAAGLIRSLKLRRGLARTVLSRLKQECPQADHLFDLVSFRLFGSGGASLGHTDIGEEYDLTVESLSAMICALDQRGILMIDKWRHRPPYETLKLVATLNAALPETDISDKLIVVSAPSTLSILFRQVSWDFDEITAAEAFCSARSLSLEYPSSPEPGSLTEGITEITGSEAADFKKGYKFFLDPPTDGSPFFHRFFRWASVQELFDLRKAGGASLTQWGYLTRIATLVMAGAAGTVLILLPSLFSRRTILPGRRSLRLLIYFSALGLGFLFVELMLIHQLTLILGHPLLSAGLVMVTFLFWAGLGSGFARHFRLQRILLIIPGILIIYLLFLTPLMRTFLSLPAAWAAPAAVLLCLPPGFFMGMPLPRGIENLQKSAAGNIPWAWAINGVASVVSPLLAAVLAIHMGFSFILAVAILLYISAFFSFPK